MAKQGLLFCALTICSIAAGILAFSLLSDSKQPVAIERAAKKFLWCMKLQELHNLPPEEFKSHPDKWEAMFCRNVFFLVKLYYKDDGRLPPGYKQALLYRFGYNQTLADAHICDLDFDRCSNQTVDHGEQNPAW